MDEIDRAWRELRADGITDSPIVRPPRVCIGCGRPPTRVLVIWADHPAQGPVILHGFVCDNCSPNVTGLTIVQMFEYAL